MLDYVIALSAELGPVMESFMQRASIFKHPVRLLLLERQSWDSGGLVENNHTDPGDAPAKRFTPSLGRAAWFDELKDAAPGHDLTDFRFEQRGVIELRKLRMTHLLAIVRNVHQVKSGGKELLKPEKELETFLARIDKEGRPLYAYFLGKTIAEGDFNGSWNRDDLLNIALTNDQKKRWKAAFDGSPPPRFSSDHPAIEIAVLVSMAGGASYQQLLELEDPPALDDLTMRQALVLTGGPSENSVTGPAEVIPPLLPDILGEWFVLNVLKRRKQTKRQHLIGQAWTLSPVGMARFIEHIAADFPQDTVCREIIGTPPKDAVPYTEFVKKSASITSAL